MKTLKEKLSEINEGETVARLNTVIAHIHELEEENSPKSENGEKAKEDK